MRRYAHNKPTVRNSNFDVVRWAGIRWNVPVDSSGAFEHCAGKYGRRARHTYGMAAHGRALGRRDGSFNGVGLLRTGFSQAMVASRCNCNVRFDYRLRDDPRYAWHDSSQHHVACSY